MPKVRERLLRESQLTLKKTDEICRASESTAARMKEVSKGDTVNSVSFRNKFGRRPRGNKGDKGDTDESAKACVIVGGYMIRITALLAGKHAITVEDVIISQPYVAVESVEVLT